MPNAAVLLGGGIVGGPRLPSVEPFDLGVVGHLAVEPFDILGQPAAYTSVEEFWIAGQAYKLSVEPFDLGSKVWLTSVEPFDILSSSDFTLPAIDLGDGEVTPATAQPIYGWWSDEDEYDQLADLTVE